MTKYDFSRYHPLDHWPGTRRCRVHYGGVRRHLWVAWHFRRRDELLHLPYKLILCRLGWHDITVLYQTDSYKVRPICKHCSYTRLPSEQEIDERKRFKL